MIQQNTTSWPRIIQPVAAVTAYKTLPNGYRVKTASFMELPACTTKLETKGFLVMQRPGNDCLSDVFFPECLYSLKKPTKQENKPEKNRWKVISVIPNKEACVRKLNSLIKDTRPTDHVRSLQHHLVNLQQSTDFCEKIYKSCI